MAEVDRQRSKAFERRVARFWGTRRTPLSGGNSGHTRSDTLHQELFIEAKTAQQYDPLWRWHDKVEGKFMMVWDSAREEPPYFVVHSKDWADMREIPMEELAGKVTPACTKERCGTVAGHLLWNVRRLAAEEEKIPMLAIGKKGKHGFLVVVHALDWDRARQIKGGE